MEMAVVEAEALAAPEDGVAGVAPEPEEQAAGVAEGEEPEVAEDLCVVEEADADGEGDGDAEEEGEGEEGEGPEGEAAGEDGEDGPGQAEGDAEAEIAEAAGVACGAGPAELVIEEGARGVGRDGGADDLAGELDAEAGAC